MPGHVIAKLKNMPDKTNVEDMIENIVSSEIDAWKQRKVKIALIGTSGAGKSSLINALLGLTAGQIGAAHVGVKETTMQPTAYQHPRNSNVEFWDLPGIGTNKFDRTNYQKSINFFEYDLFIIVSCTRFTADDSWLADTVFDSGKSFLFVRTKVALDIANDKLCFPISHDPSSVLRSIKEDCYNNLSKRNTKIFLIDSYIPSEFEFEDLVMHIVDDNENIVKETLILSLGMNLKIIVDLKKETLQRRIWGFSIRRIFQSEKGIKESCRTEFEFYREQLNLDEKSLKKEVDEEKRSVLEHDVFIIERNMLDDSRLKAIYSLRTINIYQKVTASKAWAEECLSQLCTTAYKNAAMLCAKKVDLE